MPRFEIGGEDQRTFWEIAVIGATIHERHGDIGTDGVAAEPEQLASPEAARTEAQRRIADRVADGYAPIDDGPGEHARDPDLLAAILEAPDDIAAYLVYGDWLQSVGDPRGELAMLQHQRERKPHHRKLRHAEVEFRRRHWSRMVPPRLHELDASPDSPCAVEWRCGFIHRLKLARVAEHPPYTVRELLAMVLEHPSGELLQELAIGQLGPYERYGDRAGEPFRYQAVIDTVCAFAPPALRAIELACDDVPDDELGRCELGDVTGLLARLPSLERLRLRAGSYEIHPFHESPLRSLSVVTTAGAHALPALAAARWPRLESLAVHGDDDSPAPLSALAPLLSGDRTPGLRALALTRAAATAETVAGLASSPLLARLEVLDLSEGDLGARDVEAVLAHRDRLAHLRELRLDRNCIPAASRGPLRELCETVYIDRQRGAGADAPVLRRGDIDDYSPDLSSIFRAPDRMDRDRWSGIALWETLYWGRCRGGDDDHGGRTYHVFVDVKDVQAGPSAWEAGCTCPSSKIPCKHALALLYIAERMSLVPIQRPPEGFVEECRASRYDDDWG